ncbi:MAG: geranylgeranyl reductase family protein [Acidobacteria bacterium]|nr:geranylgeranyl reductase family protein [Acidobacteriota bacterium]
MSSSPLDALVIGGGPAGASAVWSLAKAGRRVLILEKEVLPRVKPCGGGVSPQIAGWFDFDFAPVISNRVTRLRFTWKSGEALEAPLGTEEPLWMVKRSDFDHFLVKQAMAKGAALKDGTAAMGLRFEDGAWTVDTAHGPIRASYLIAADGAKGPAAKWLGFTDRKRYVAGALEAEFPGLPAQSEVMHLDFGTAAKGYAWNFPKGDGQGLGLGVFRGKQSVDLKATLAGYTETFGVPLSACHLMAHPIHCWDGDQVLHTQQAVLAGEAACVVDPFTAEGIRPSIFSGLRAAEAIHRALSGEDRALEGYTRIMQEQWGAEMVWAKRLSQLFYAAPRLGWKVMVGSPGSPQRMASILMGEATYRQHAARAIKKLSFGFAG